MTLCLVTAACLFCLPATHAAIVWDGEAGTQWWFNPVNWNENSNANLTLPGDSGTDAQINGGFLLGQEGVVYDPNNDPAFTPAGPQSIGPLYITRNTNTNNLLTIKGDLTATLIQVGRSSGVEGVTRTGTIIQTAGTVSIPTSNLELGTGDTSNRGLGAGTYDYRGGILDIAWDNAGVGMRLSHGSASNGPANDPNGNPLPPELVPVGASGPGRFIMHNPTTGGYVRSFDVQIASFAGIIDSPTVITTVRDPDGVNRGVGTFEFHYENGGVRPFQVSRNLSINNGFMNTTGGTRSSRLELVLGEAPCTGAGCVPEDIGLFDVNFGNIFNGVIVGAGDLNGDQIFDNDRVFSNGDASIHYYEGDTVSATFGNTQYNWTISYSGDISWLDADNSVVDTILGAGNGGDIVLMGHSSSTFVSANFNSDDFVDGIDFLTWQRNAGGAGAFADGDANGDGQVNGLDLVVWESQYGTAPLQAVIAAVPEPSSVLLLSLGCCGLAMRRRK